MDSQGWRKKPRCQCSACNANHHLVLACFETCWATAKARLATPHPARLSLVALWPRRHVSTPVKTTPCELVGSSGLHLCLVWLLRPFHPPPKGVGHTDLAVCWPEPSGWNIIVFIEQNSKPENKTWKPNMKYKPDILSWIQNWKLKSLKCKAWKLNPEIKTWNQSLK